jgi:hypothetical protein
MMKRIIGSLALLLAAASTGAQPIPKINSISQEYAQRGASVQITLTGENIGDGKILVSGEPGLKVSIQPPSTPNIAVESNLGGVSAVAQSDPKKLVATIEIEATAPVGARELRVVSAGGVSNPMTVNVSHLPEVKGDSKATSFETAQWVTLPVGITASLDAPAESDFYRFALKKGDRVVVDALGQRIGSQIDTSIAIFDAKKNEVTRNEDAIGNDSVLEFKAPEDGEYILQARDYRMQGGKDFKYRLQISSGPFVTGTFPLGGKRGETTAVELRGYNLEGASKMVLKLDVGAALGQQALRTVSPMGLSNPFPFLVSDLPQVMESEPNTSVTHANLITLPAAINGRIQNAKDYDAFRFHAEKDQRFIFDVIAQKFGSPLDALLTLTDANGNVLQRNDDANSADARIDQTFAASGDYILFIEDLMERGGPNFVYRINCSQPAPEFEVRFVNDAVRLARGGRVPVRCEVTRLNNFAEPVRIVAKNLGSGLHAEPLLILPSDPGAGLLFISAAPDAQLGTSPLALEATAVVGGKNVTVPVKAFATDRAVKDGFVTVLESSPFLVHSGQLLATAEQDQTVDLQALVERQNGFAGEVKVTLEGFSAGRDPIAKSFDFQPIIVKGTEDEGTLKVKTKLDSEIGARMVVFRGEATMDGQATVQYSAPFPVRTTQIPFVLSTSLKRVTLTAIAAGSQSSAGEAFFTVKADRRAGFDGEITMQVEGAPEGVTVTAEKMAAGARESNVKLVASEKAVVGKEVQLTLTGVGNFHEKTYRFKPATIALQVNAPEPVDVKTAAVGEQK